MGITKRRNHQLATVLLDVVRIFNLASFDVQFASLEVEFFLEVDLCALTKEESRALPHLFNLDANSQEMRVNAINPELHDLPIVADRALAVTDISRNTALDIGV